jgi:transcriptional regulator with XRE-family HTH domain
MPMQPATLMIDDVELVGKIKENPLYIYRTANGNALRNIAARLGRSQTTVSKWEDGSAYPTDDNMALLAKLMKVDLDKLKTQWREWFNKHVMTNEVNTDGKVK